MKNTQNKAGNKKESMSLMVFGELFACLLYGGVLGAFTKEEKGLPAIE